MSNIIEFPIHGDPFVVVNRRSPFTGKESSMRLAISGEEYNCRFKSWQAGTLIQDAFPMLSASEREFIKTGISPEEWDAMFGEDE